MIVLLLCITGLLVGTFDVGIVYALNEKALKQARESTLFHSLPSRLTPLQPVSQPTNKKTTPRATSPSSSWPTRR